MFQHSSYSRSGWPAARNEHYALHHTRQAFRVLFSLFYGAQLTGDVLAGRYWDIHDETQSIDGDILDVVSAICAYSEFFKCGEKIKPAVVCAMQSSPSYWRAIAAEPKRHMSLARKLELEDLYHDALRHMAAQANYRVSRFGIDWEEVADAMGSTEDEVRNFFIPQLERNIDRASELEIDLLKLSPEPVQDFSCRHHTVLTTFMEFLQGPYFSNKSISEEATRFASRALFSQWYIDSIHGDRVEKGLTRTKSDSKRLNLTVLKIEQAATSHDASDIFDIPIPSRFAALFEIGIGFDSAGSMRRQLGAIVMEAGLIVRNTFPPNLFDVYHETFGKCTAGRAHFDAHHAGYFTYMMLPINVPWIIQELPVVSQSDHKFPVVEMMPASAQWVWAIYEFVYALSEHWRKF